MFLLEGKLPKISCLMVTASSRFDHFCRSFDCYSRQTYPNREIVIVNEGPLEYQRQIAEYAGGRSDVRFVFLDGVYNLGSLRNISVSMSSGEIFVQWDDDDFNTPERIAVQFSDLNNHPEFQVSFLGEQLHYYFTDGKLYWNNWVKNNSGGKKEYGLIPGTIMAWRKNFDLRYPSAGWNSRSGEDSILAFRLLEGGYSVRILEGFGYMHVYSYHGQNVWDEEHHQKISRDRSQPIAFLRLNRDRLQETIKCLGFSGPVFVTGNDGHAFAYEVK
jgi:glycosyltransferase involved in cell wall biosynthesis